MPFSGEAFPLFPATAYRCLQSVWQELRALFVRMFDPFDPLSQVLSSVEPKPVKTREASLISMVFISHSAAFRRWLKYKQCLKRLGEDL